MFKKVVVALDGSDHARKALDIAVGLAHSFNSRLILVHAVSEAPLTEDERNLAQTEYHERIGQAPPSTIQSQDASLDLWQSFPMIQQAYTETTQRIRATLARDMLESARRDAIAQGASTVEIQIGSGDPARVIIDVAKSEEADLIVMGSRGLNDLQGLLLGSNSHKVAHLSPCTCITVK